MATLQELMDEAVADVLRKHGVSRDLREALKRSGGPALKRPAKPKVRHRPRRTRPERGNFADRPEAYGTAGPKHEVIDRRRCS